MALRGQARLVGRGAFNSHFMGVASVSDLPQGHSLAGWDGQDRCVPNTPKPTHQSLVHIRPLKVGLTHIRTSPMSLSDCPITNKQFVLDQSFVFYHF